jgi:microcystin-dependent protein
MSEPFLSEIRIMSFGFAPKGWALCSGQLLPINQNQALFALHGTTFGGDGRVNFALPNLQGTTPIHRGNAHVLGENGGEQSHTLVTSEVAMHVHVVNASKSKASSGEPGPGVMVSSSTGSSAYGVPQDLVPMDPSTDSSVGGGQPHLNMQPFLALTFCIALQGIFPSPN